MRASSAALLRLCCRTPSTLASGQAVNFRSLCSCSARRTPRAVFRCSCARPRGPLSPLPGGLGIGIILSPHVGPSDDPSPPSLASSAERSIRHPTCRLFSTDRPTAKPRRSREADAMLGGCRRPRTRSQSFSEGLEPGPRPEPVRASSAAIRTLGSRVAGAGVMAGPRKPGEKLQDSRSSRRPQIRCTCIYGPWRPRAFADSASVPQQGSATRTTRERHGGK
ncbi:hypothetical protein OH76DRAFT_1253762 [Lentinus brumalis]|uniref:Uncharacterized protein n=1 Tax=Lentinus brumalis TaxID=2498619 RepID=A0A371CRG7_9APHY|nr:hypothetical protein OH76DRAFT_1253762 [Polyporus brumalis]